jgi:hypothetical protein
MGDNHRPVSREHRPCIVPLGGFLGAGKTSLILAAARLLHARDLRAAAILNDQGADLVDTHFAQANGVRADQVAGGCFCCRFSELMDAAERLSSDSPDVIFIEAVGSCTDISATVLQPLKLEFAGRFRLAPYTVLIDPERAREWLEPGEESDLAFLFRKQIEEADLACFTKSDIHASFPPLAAGVPVRYLSSHTGQGVAEWLDEILAGRFPAARILDLDYDRYARAEASLAWLNCAATARLATPLSPAMVVGPLLEALDAALAAEGLAIAHLKVMDESPSGWLQASVVRNGAEPVVRGMLDASPAAAHHLLLNVRAAGEPAALRRIVETQLARVPGRVRVRAIQCFSPSPPKPERRLSYVVKGPD